jgi:hypothetical protein
MLSTLAAIEGCRKLAPALNILGGGHLFEEREMFLSLIRKSIVVLSLGLMCVSARAQDMPIVITESENLPLPPADSEQPPQTVSQPNDKSLPADASVPTIATAISPAIPSAIQANSPQAICLASEDSNACRLVAHSVQFFIHVENGGARVFYQMPTDAGFRDVAVKDVLVELDQMVASGKMSSDNAALIASDILSRSEMSYQVPPTQAELKTAVGFSSEQSLSVEDQLSLIQVHLQMTLGVSPLTAYYLAQPLALELINANHN